jgi:aminoglycoside phosphotransferase (APT) family kinase protein
VNDHRMTVPMSNEREPNRLPLTVYRWIADVTKAVVAEAVRLPGGNRREAWLVHLEEPDHSRKTLFLRYDSADPSKVGEYYTIRREADVYRVVTSFGIMAPPIVAVHPTLELALFEAIKGESELKKVSDASVRSTIMSDFIRELAKLHSVDAADIAMSGLGPVKSLQEHVEDELTIWEQLYRHAALTDPLIEFSISWLRHNVPIVPAPVVIVHGDAGPGNFLFFDGRLSAIIDWELSHLGDPMEDFAWMSLRSVFEPLPEWETCLHQYAQLMGVSIDYGRLRYHRVFVQLRVAIIRHRQTGDPTPSGDVANGLLSFAVNRRLLVEALEDAMGVQLPETEEQFAADVTPRTWLYDSVLAILRDSVVARSTDPLVLVKAKSAARIVKYLQESDKRSASFEELERVEIASLFDDPHMTLTSGRERLIEAIRSRDISDAELLGYMDRVVRRDSALMASASGALKNRHHPKLLSGEAT